MIILGPLGNRLVATIDTNFKCSCLKCDKVTGIQNEVYKLTSSHTLIEKGACVECGTTNRSFRKYVPYMKLPDDDYIYHRVNHEILSLPSLLRGRSRYTKMRWKVLAMPSLEMDNVYITQMVEDHKPKRKSVKKKKMSWLGHRGPWPGETGFPGTAQQPRFTYDSTRGSYEQQRQGYRAAMDSYRGQQQQQARDQQQMAQQHQQHMVQQHQQQMAQQHQQQMAQQMAFMQGQMPTVASPQAVPPVTVVGQNLESSNPAAANVVFMRGMYQQRRSERDEIGYCSPICQCQICVILDSERVEQEERMHNDRRRS